LRKLVLAAFVRLKHIVTIPRLNLRERKTLVPVHAFVLWIYVI